MQHFGNTARLRMQHTQNTHTFLSFGHWLFLCCCSVYVAAVVSFVILATLLLTTQLTCKFRTPTRYYISLYPPLFLSSSPSLASSLSLICFHLLFSFLSCIVSFDVVINALTVVLFSPVLMFCFPLWQHTPTHSRPSIKYSLYFVLLCNTIKAFFVLHLPTTTFDISLVCIFFL